MTTMTPHDLLSALHSSTPVPLDHLPSLSGIYALYDTDGIMRYIGSTQDFRDRIWSRHVTGTEGCGHKFSTEMNQHLFYVDRDTLDHHRWRADAVREVRARFIRQHYRASFVPVVGTKAELEAIERAVHAIADPENILWNDRRTPSTRLKGGIVKLLIDFMKTEAVTPLQRGAMQTQAALWRKAYGM